MLQLARELAVRRALPGTKGPSAHGQASLVLGDAHELEAEPRLADACLRHDCHEMRDPLLARTGPRLAERGQLAGADDQSARQLPLPLGRKRVLCEPDRHGSRLALRRYRLAEL